MCLATYGTLASIAAKLEKEMTFSGRLTAEYSSVISGWDPMRKMKDKTPCWWICLTESRSEMAPVTRDCFPAINRSTTLGTFSRAVAKIRMAIPSAMSTLRPPPRYGAFVRSEKNRTIVRELSNRTTGIARLPYVTRATRDWPGWTFKYFINDLTKAFSVPYSRKGTSEEQSITNTMSAFRVDIPVMTGTKSKALWAITEFEINDFVVFPSSNQFYTTGGWSFSTLRKQ